MKIVTSMQFQKICVWGLFLFVFVSVFVVGLFVQHASSCLTSWRHGYVLPQSCFLGSTATSQSPDKIQNNKDFRSDRICGQSWLDGQDDKEAKSPGHPHLLCKSPAFDAQFPKTQATEIILRCKTTDQRAPEKEASCCSPGFAPKSQGTEQNVSANHSPGKAFSLLPLPRGSVPGVSLGLMTTCLDNEFRFHVRAFPHALWMSTRDFSEHTVSFKGTEKRAPYRFGRSPHFCPRGRLITYLQLKSVRSILQAADMLLLLFAEPNITKTVKKETVTSDRRCNLLSHFSSWHEGTHFISRGKSC